MQGLKKVSCACVVVLFLGAGLSFLATGMSASNLNHGNGASGSSTVPVYYKNYDVLQLLNGTQTVNSLNWSSVIVNCSFFEDHSSNSIINLLDSRFSSFASYGPFSLIVYHAKNYRNDILSDWKSALGTFGGGSNVVPTKVFSNNSSFSTSPFQSADVVALSYTPDPFFIFGYGVDLSNMQEFTSYVEESVQQTSPSTPAVTISNNGYTCDVTSTPITVKEIGGNGWFESTSGNGFNSALYKYCEGQEVINGNTYYWFVSNVSHQVQGYPQSLGGWKAWKFQDVTDWFTSTYPGQVACANTPTGSGYQSFNSNSPLFTLNAGASFNGFSLGINYPIYYGTGPNLNWRDSSNLAVGCVDTNYRLGDCADVGTTYTVHSISIGLLNPTKSGGYPPMVIEQKDPACLQSYWDDTSCSMPYNTTCCYLCPSYVS